MSATARGWATGEEKERSWGSEYVDKCHSTLPEVWAASKLALRSGPTPKQTDTSQTKGCLKPVWAKPCLSGEHNREPTSLLHKPSHLPREGGYHDPSLLKGDLCQLREDAARHLWEQEEMERPRRVLGLRRHRFRSQTQVQVPAPSTSQPVSTVENLWWADTT